MRGKVLLCYAGLLSSIKLRHLFYLYAIHYFATGSGVKYVDHLDPRRHAVSCYVAYRLGFITNSIFIFIINLLYLALIKLILKLFKG